MIINYEIIERKTIFLTQIKVLLFFPASFGLAAINLSVCFICYLSQHISLFPRRDFKKVHFASLRALASVIVIKAQKSFCCVTIALRVGIFYFLAQHFEIKVPRIAPEINHIELQNSIKSLLRAI